MVVSGVVTGVLSCALPICHCCFLFFFNDTATTEIYTLSLHDALPISTFEQSGTVLYLIVNIIQTEVVGWCLMLGGEF